MKDDKELSIIVPFYNSADVLPDCIRFIEEQTLCSDLFEVIFVDDGSDDDGRGLITEHMKNSVLDYKLLWHTINKGPGAARNLGLSAAKGKFLLLLDSDDGLETSACEKLLAAANTYGADFTFADTCWKSGKINRRQGDYSFNRKGLISSNVVSKSLQHRIRNSNRKNDLVKLIHQIAEQDMLPGKVVVINNGESYEN